MQDTRTNWGEAAIGAVVLLLAIVFLVYSLGVAGAGRMAGGYTLNAKFGDAGALAPGAKVTISGVKVGSVASIRIDPKSFLAITRLNIDSDIQVPTDSTAKITSDGLLGGAHIVLAPGGATTNMKNGDEFVNTQGSVDLFGLIGQFLRPHDDAPAASSSSAAASGAAGAGGKLPDE